MLSIMIGVASFASGYISTSAYQLTRGVVDFASMAKVASLMNLIFSVAVVSGLLLSFALRGAMAL